jgi:predicted glycogen debranching enzyme
MDARVDGREITPRIGKPVEIQALWLNALAIGARFSARWQTLFEKGRAAFENRFWNEEAEHLADVIDCNHRRGDLDLTFRPNQIFAVGGLPLQVLSGGKARRVVDAVEARLLTPLGLRSLAPGESGYTAHYGGSVAQRDGGYHQGTVWPWLLGLGLLTAFATLTRIWRPLVRLQTPVTVAGWVFLLALMAYATVHDVVRIV